MRGVSVTHPDCRQSRYPAAGSKTRSNRWHRPCYPRMLRRRGCIWLRRLCQWHVPYVLYIAISTECPVTADYIERPVPLPVKPDRRRSRLSSISASVKRFFLPGERKRPCHLRPVKKSRFQVALWKSYHISSQWLEKEIFRRFCSHRCGSRASSVYDNWYVNAIVVLWAEFYLNNRRERKRLFFSIGGNTMSI